MLVSTPSFVSQLQRLALLRGDLRCLLQVQGIRRLAAGADTKERISALRWAFSKKKAQHADAFELSCVGSEKLATSGVSFSSSCAGISIHSPGLFCLTHGYYSIEQKLIFKMTFLTCLLD